MKLLEEANEPMTGCPLNMMDVDVLNPVEVAIRNSVAAVSRGRCTDTNTHSRKLHAVWELSSTIPGVA